MKKLSFTAAGFIIFAAVFLTACQTKTDKIKPDDYSGARKIITKNAAEKKPAEKTEIIKLPEIPKPDIQDGAIKNRDKKWTAVFDNGEILDALNKLDVSVATVGRIEIRQLSDDGCAATLSVGGRYLSAFEFKEALGLKSTMITEIKRGIGEYTFSGFGEN